MGLGMREKYGEIGTEKVLGLQHLTDFREGERAKLLRSSVMALFFGLFSISSIKDFGGAFEKSLLSGYPPRF